MCLWKISVTFFDVKLLPNVTFSFYDSDNDIHKHLPKGYVVNS